MRMNDIHKKSIVYVSRIKRRVVRRIHIVLILRGTRARCVSRGVHGGCGTSRGPFRYTPNHVHVLRVLKNTSVRLRSRIH